MMPTLVSSKYQVVIPKKVRKAVSLKPGQKLYSYAVGDQIVLTPKKKWPQDYLTALQGLWGGLDITGYINQERSAWE